MADFWENKFSEIGTIWGFEPADSTLKAMELFRGNIPGKILIPGVGYGRNAKPFLENGFEVTGIEISGKGIQLARQNGLNFPIYHGSVTQMPFDGEVYDGVYCYALIHLLNKPERKAFLKNCYNQLTPGGLMVFVTTSTRMSACGQGRKLSKDRFNIEKGLSVFFYDHDSVVREFLDFGLVECVDIEEPVKFMENEPPLPMKYIVCRKEPSIHKKSGNLRVVK